MSLPRIAVDAMGGDKAPLVPVAGAVEAARQGWTRLSRDPKGNPGYRVYQHSCGHVQRVARVNMSWGQVKCARCGSAWNARHSFIYLLRIDVPQMGLHVLKLGFSKTPVKRHRHQLGLPRSASGHKQVGVYTQVHHAAVDVAHVKTLPKVLDLGRLKQQAALAELPLVQKGSRLSVMPVTPEQWAAIVALR